MQNNNIIMLIDTADFTSNDYNAVGVYKIADGNLVPLEQYTVMDIIEFQNIVDRIYNEWRPVTYFKNGIKNGK